MSKKKILFLTMNLGKTSSGIVFERLIYELSIYYEIDVITFANATSINLARVNKITTISYFSKSMERILSKLKLVSISDFVDLRPKIRRLLIGLFSTYPLDILWCNKVLKLLIKEENKYHLVFSLAASTKLAPIYSGEKISRTLNSKWILYCVDPIPPPIFWELDTFYSDGVKRFVKKYFPKLDALFSANQIMLDYQLGLFPINNNCFTDVLLNPSLGGLKNYKPATSKIFLYTGVIGGARRVNHIFKAFKLILKIYPDAEMYFVGSEILESEFEYFTIIERNSVSIFPRTTDLAPYYKKALCFIDIDADAENDLFLSSKITNYITINRPIICATGKDSPSRKIFSGIPSIIQCQHDELELYNAMKNVIENPITNFEDRNGVLMKFDLKLITNNLKNEIDQIIG